MTLPEINVFVPFVFVFIISIGKTHTSKDEKHLTRHWREITLTSALLWQSIEFITSYNLEYHWPGLCLTHLKKCTIDITITCKALHNATYSDSPLFVHMIINKPINIQMQKPTLG